MCWCRTGVSSQLSGRTRSLPPPRPASSCRPKIPPQSRSARHQPVHKRNPPFITGLPPPLLPFYGTQRLACLCSSRLRGVQAAHEWCVMQEGAFHQGGKQRAAAAIGPERRGAGSQGPPPFCVLGRPAPIFDMLSTHNCGVSGLGAGRLADTANVQGLARFAVHLIVYFFICFFSCPSVEACLSVHTHTHVMAPDNCRSRDSFEPNEFLNRLNSPSDLSPLPIFPPPLSRCVLCDAGHPDLKVGVG